MQQYFFLWFVLQFWCFWIEWFISSASQFCPIYIENLMHGIFVLFSGFHEVLIFPPFLFHLSAIFRYFFVLKYNLKYLTWCYNYNACCFNKERKNKKEKKENTLQKADLFSSFSLIIFLIHVLPLLRSCLMEFLCMHLICSYKNQRM